MREHGLQPRTPLGNLQPETVTIGPVTIAEVTSFALVSVATRRGRAADFAVAAGASGIPLPTPGRFANGAPFAAFWIGPDQWMVEAPFATHEDIAAILSSLFGGAASITEQTDAWARFDVTTADPPALFERLCNHDLRRHGPGSATRTVIDHLGCYLLFRSSQSVSVLGPRSAARSLHHALVTAVRSVF